MNINLGVHMRVAYTVEVKRIHPSMDTVYLATDDDENSFTLYFPTPLEMRLWLSKALNALRVVEQGDIPFSTHKDRIEYEVVK